MSGALLAQNLHPQGSVLSQRVLEAYSWHIDQASGNDSSSGRMWNAPLKTVAAWAAKTKRAGEVTGVARGSVWHETITCGYNYMGLIAYGVGAKPLFDQSDPLSGWTKTDGYTYIYQADRTVEPTRPHVELWEDAVRMPLAADLATLDTTAGDYWFDSTAPTTVYVHATGDGNPATNGKLYEYNARSYGINGSAYGGTLAGLWGRRASYQTNSIGGGRAALMWDLLVEDGSTHLLWVSEDSQVRRCTLHGQGNIITYAGNGDPKSYTIMEDCYAYDDVYAGNNAVYSHTGGGETTPFGTFRFNRFKVRNRSGLSSSATNMIFDGGDIVSTGPFGIAGGQPAGRFTLMNTTIDVTGGTTPNVSFGGPGLIENSTIISRGRTAQAVVSPAGGNMMLTVSNSSIICYDYNWGQLVGFNGAGMEVTVNNSHLAFINTTTKSLSAISDNYVPGTSFAGDYNTYECTNCTMTYFWHWQGSNYSTLAAWQAATNQEAHSTLTLLP